MIGAKVAVPLFMLIASLCSFALSAQVSFYQPDTAVRVFAYGHERTIAGCGGFNNPQFAMADLNNDHKEDLIVYERNVGITTFINKGLPGAPLYRYAPEFALNFPPVYNYIHMADYNCDGITDLFQGYTGYTVYKGYYNAVNQLCFTYYKELYYDNDPAHPPTQAFNNPGDIPAVADVDNDGDLDFVAYDGGGEYMYYYKNLRVELGLPCDSIRIALKDRCWGKAYQGFSRAHDIPRTCDNSSLLRPAGPGNAAKLTHTGNAICVFDWDMDGDKDYLDGSVSFNEIIFLKNGRIEHGSGPDSMVAQDTMWQTGGKRVVIPSWPAAFHVDIGQDGKKDLLFAPNGAGAENYNCIWYYKNNTTPGMPDWQFQSDSFLTDKTIDAGTGSMPMLYDYDRDGKPDLIVGSDGYRQSNGILRSRLSLYKNISTPGSPSFELVANDLMGINAANFRGAAPAAGDIDDDGKDDLVLGHLDGTLSYYKNMAATNALQPDWQLNQLALTDEAGALITVDANAAPFIYDIDKDGKPDLLIGNVYGTIRYYRNRSTVPGVIKLKLENTMLGMAKSDPLINFGTYSTPFIGRMDSTGNDYLLMGSNSGKLYQYTGFQTGNVTGAYTLIDSQYSFIDTTFNAYNRPATYSGLYTNHRTSVAIGDVDASGAYTMVLGNVRGGLQFFKRKVYVAGLPQLQEAARISAYPNPASDVLNVSWSDVLQDHVQLSIIDMSGRQLHTRQLPASPGHVSIPLSAIPPGVYTCLLQSGVNRYYSKFIIIR